MSEAASQVLNTAVQGAVNAMANQLPKETPPTDPKATTPAPQEDPKVSSKLSILMKREQAALEVEKRSKQMLADAEARSNLLATKEAKIKEFESLKDTNPMAALKLLGLDYQDLTSVALADGNVSPDIKIKQMNDKVDNYLKAQEAEKETRAKEAKAQEEAKVAQAEKSFRADIGTYISDNKSKYQFIDFEGQTDLVYEVIDEHYTRTLDKATGVGQIMKISDAADRVEAYLESKNEDRLKLDKVKSKLGPQPTQFVVKPERTLPVQKQMRTLTNQQSATATRPTSKILTDDERIAKAIAYARGLRP